MKLALDLGKWRQANVWLDDLPAANFDSEETKEFLCRPREDCRGNAKLRLKF
jgi:hypothetical protein